LAGAQLLPFERADFEAAIECSGIGVAASLRAFQRGFAAAASVGAEQASLDAPLRNEPPGHTTKPESAGAAPRLTALDARIAESFPAEAHRVLRAGVRRLTDYQDSGYASAYLDRLEPIRALDGGRTAPRWALLTETARYLALWMSYEDTVRVAELKIRSARFDRVADEVKLGEGQVLHIDEFLHPPPIAVDGCAVDHTAAQDSSWIG